MCLINKYKISNKKIIYINIILIVAIIVIAIIIPKFLDNNFINSSNIKKYTWEDYVQLSPKKQDEFRRKFNSDEEFYKWLYSQGNEILVYPWEVKGIHPTEYTYEEYEMLSEKEKDAFRKCFDSKLAFDLWYKNVKGVDENVETNNKSPEDYSWSEFEAMTPKQQEAFFSSFESEETLVNWLESGGSQ